MSIIEHVTLQKIVAHDFRYDPRIVIQLREVFSFMPTFKETLNLFQRVKQISGMLNRYGPDVGRK